MATLSVILLLLLTILIRNAIAAFGSDGVCPIYLFAPFVYRSGAKCTGILADETTIGLSQLAAALLAVKHFKTRNSSVVPEIATLPDSCTVTLELPVAFNAIFFSSGSIQALASDNSTLCAMVGPYDDPTSADLSVMAQAHSIPLVTTKSYDLIIVSDMYHQFSSSVHPDLLTSSRVIAEYLVYKGRTNFIAILHDVTPVNLQRREALGLQLDTMQVKWISSSFALESQMQDPRSVYTAMKRIKESGYRTIVICQANPWFSYQKIADAAEELGMNNGGHFYVWFDEFEKSIGQGGNANVSKLTEGSAWIITPPMEYVNKDSVFSKVWMEQGQDLVDAVNELYPITPDSPGYLPAPENFFQTIIPELGSAHMFDAVMSVGFGACISQETAATDRAAVSGLDHNAGIRKASFQGATGRVRFGADTFDRKGTRAEDTVYWAAVNLLPPPKMFQISDFLDATEEHVWMEAEPFIYADGSTSPPELLRDIPEQNYLSTFLRALGLALMGMTMLAAIICLMWVFVCRKHKVLAASQPIFLYMICFGCFVQTSAILPLSVDENFGWSVKQLDQACMAFPWLLALGYIIVYSALFTKLWRVNKVLQFTRRQIKMQHVAWPMTLLFLAALVMLIIWTLLDPLRWTRVEINEFTGESIGKCESNNSFAYFIPLVVIMLIPTVLTCIMAYKTKDVDDSYTESWWIFILVVVQIEVILVAVPVIIILNEESTDGKYLGFIFMLWSFPMTTLCLIFVPKMAAYRNDILGLSVGAKYKRGERGQSRVSGVTVSGSTSGVKASAVTASNNRPVVSSLVSEPEEDQWKNLQTESTAVSHQSNDRNADRQLQKAENPARNYRQGSHGAGGGPGLNNAASLGLVAASNPCIDETTGEKE
ncbi:hypothetical protein ACA910_003465 [Epithemia clementina (nom. ined.)]